MPRLGLRLGTEPVRPRERAPAAEARLTAQLRMREIRTAEPGGKRRMRCLAKAHAGPSRCRSRSDSEG
jgi:hypothetical protein